MTVGEIPLADEAAADADLEQRTTPYTPLYEHWSGTCGLQPSISASRRRRFLS